MVDINSEDFNMLMRCQQAVQLLMRERERLELSNDETDTLMFMGNSITEDIELITGKQIVIK